MFIRRALTDDLLKAARSFAAVILTGPRRSGKTTLLYCLAGLEEIDRGELAWDGLAVAPLRPAARAPARAVVPRTRPRLPRHVREPRRLRVEKPPTPRGL